MADLIVGSLSSMCASSGVSQESVEVFFSAHGVPESYVREGDPYKEEMEHCVALIMAELQRRGVKAPHTLAYQSRVGPVEWLRPYTDDSIRCGLVPVRRRRRFAEAGAAAACLL
jgi:ferrochelatase